jgi:hypothetical protein
MGAALGGVPIVLYLIAAPIAPISLLTTDGTIFTERLAMPGRAPVRAHRVPLRGSI